MRSGPRGFLYFLLAVAAVAVSLKALNWLPTVLQTGMMSRFDSIEEVQAKLRIPVLYVPSYFPQSITWPPAEILAQSKPYPAVLMTFRSAEKHDIALVISQAGSSTFSSTTLIPFHRITRSVTYDVKGRKALLDVGTCTDNEICSRLSWTENSTGIVLTMKAPPSELIRIAESMHQ